MDSYQGPHFVSLGGRSQSCTNCAFICFASSINQSLSPIFKRISDTFQTDVISFYPGSTPTERRLKICDPSISSRGAPHAAKNSEARVALLLSMTLTRTVRETIRGAVGRRSEFFFGYTDGTEQGRKPLNEHPLTVGREKKGETTSCASYRESQNISTSAITTVFIMTIASDKAH